MNQQEIWDKIDPFLNKGEKKYYDTLADSMSFYKKIINQFQEKLDNKEWENEDQKDSWERSIFDATHSLEFYEEQSFRFERRIIEGYKKETKDPPQVNVDDFEMENQGDWKENGETVFAVNNIQDLEQKQIDSQKGLKFTKDQKDALTDYFNVGCFDLNSKLNNGRRWQRYAESTKKEKLPRINKLDKNLSEAISVTKGLTQDTVLYRGDYFDVAKTVGDHIKFKGYLSTTYLQESTEKFYMEHDYPKECYYTYKLLLPKGTKGLCANDLSQGKFSTHFAEHELLLNKGLEVDIVDIDYENQVVTVVATP